MSRQNSMIYSLVSRGQLVLVDHSSSSGNFPQVAVQVLSKTNPSKTFGQYVTANYQFVTFCKEGFIFLTMVDSNYETRIAVNFLKRIQEAFFTRYDYARRNNAVAHSLKDFKPFLQEQMGRFSNREEVDKLSNLRKELSDLEETALANMNKVIDRGEKIQVIAKKSQVLSDQSLDMRNTSRKVKNRMWWKNKKVMIGIVIAVVVVIAVIVIIIVV